MHTAAGGVIAGRDLHFLFLTAERLLDSCVSGPRVRVAGRCRLRGFAER